MSKNISIILLIQLLALVVIAFGYIPIDTPILLVLPIFALIVRIFIGFAGIIFGLILTILSFEKKYKNHFKYIYIWYIYCILLLVVSKFSTYTQESLEVFNTDRGDILPPLPIFQQNVGFYLYSLMFTIPLTILVFYIKQKIKTKK
jgi:hypothetical protein